MPSWMIPREEGEARARNIDLLALDVDGVLTDGTLYFADDVAEVKGFNVHDGHGIRLWQRAGKDVAVITGRTSRALDLRCADLDIRHVYQGAKNKTEAFHALLKEAGTVAERVCYVGDELVDIPVFRQVGLAVAVADAVAETVAAAHLVTDRQGGRGAVREVIDLLLKLQDHWLDVTARYFEK